MSESTGLCRVVRVDEVRPHPNADRLQMCRIGGWWVASGLDVKEGDIRVYIEVDTCLDLGLAEEFGISQYTQSVGKGPCIGMERVRAVKLRGVPSCGVLLPGDGYDESDIGRDLTMLYGARKYETINVGAHGEPRAEHPCFFKYIKIMNLNSGFSMFEDGEEVYITEKIHGTNSRVGRIDGEIMVGSHNIQREIDLNCIYSMPLQLEGVRNLLEMTAGNFILYGEIYGPGIQDMDYGMDKPEYVAFGMMVDGLFLPPKRFRELMVWYEIPVAPLLYRGGFSMDAVRNLTDGQTLISRKDRIRSKFKGREGIVITSANHATIAKSVSFDYLSREGGTEAH